MSGKYKYLFGPVPSRRLGRSLGIDVTPDKTCSYDCLFCQCGKTATLSTERGETVPLEEVCAEVERWLADDGEADVITFAGSGEPTLYSRLGELISFIKEKTDIPVIVLSNGTLLHRPDVREELCGADMVKISLSAWDEASFQKINRPACDLSFETLVEGEREFRECFSGQLWLEVFLLEGINAAPEQVEKITKIAATIQPDKIHLNTAVRPPADTGALPVSAKTLASFCDLFTPPAEVIASFAPANPASGKNVDLAALIHRHPATADQLAAMTGSTPDAIEDALAPLLRSGQLRREERNGEAYYK